MRRSSWLIGIAFAAGMVCLIPARTHGQTPVQAPSQNQAKDDEDVIRFDTKLVTVHASVFDKNGRLVTGLPQSAFKLFEDKIEQPIKLFRAEDVPVSMGIILDNSGSMRDKRSSVAAAALALVRASNPEDEVFIVDFNDDVYLDCDFTNDIKRMQETLERIDSHGGTAMRNAISLSIDKLKTDAKKDKKVLVVVTDGNDNSSAETTPELLMRKVQNSDGVLIYSIGLLNEEEPGEAKKAKRALKELAEASGGFDYYPKDLAEVSNITPEIAGEIRHQYTLGYRPNTALDGAFHTLRVDVKGHGTARTRSGYYAKSAPDAKPAAKAPESNEPTKR